MSSDPSSPSAQPASHLAAISIDSSAALTLCGILLEVLSQLPEARALVCAALERGEADPLPEDPTARAAALIAIGRLRDACHEPALRAA